MEAFAGRKWRLSHILFALTVVYLLFVGFKFYRILDIVGLNSGERNFSDDGRRTVKGNDVAEVSRPLLVSTYAGSLHRSLDDGNPPRKPNGDPLILPAHRKPVFSFDHFGRITGAIMQRRRHWSGNLTELERMTHDAWDLGMKAWEEVKNYVDEGELNPAALLEGKQEPCPLSVSMGKNEIGAKESLMFLPCGLEVGSSITVIGTPHSAHEEYVPQLARLKQGNGVVMMSQFTVELQGLKAADGEEPPKILHFNPRLKGDWSGRPVIEHNTCYRMQWGKSMRCDGIASNDDDDTGMLVMLLFLK